MIQLKALKASFNKIMFENRITVAFIVVFKKNFKLLVWYST